VQTAANRFVGALTVLKLIVHPAITAVLAWYVFVLPPQIATIAIALAALPTGTGPFMITEFYARDGKVTAGTILATTLASVITLAAILSLLGIGVGMTAKSG
jgi:predicted permease